MSLRRINRKVKEMENPRLYEKRKAETKYLWKRFLKKLFWSLLIMAALPQQCMLFYGFQPLFTFFIDAALIAHLVKEFLLSLNQLKML